MESADTVVDAPSSPPCSSYCSEAPQTFFKLPKSPAEVRAGGEDSITPPQQQSRGGSTPDPHPAPCENCSITSDELPRHGVVPLLEGPWRGREWRSQPNCHTPALTPQLGLGRGIL